MKKYVIDTNALISFRVWANREREAKMQHTITVSIPEKLEPRFRRIIDVNAFASVVIAKALQQNIPPGSDGQLEKAVELMLDEYANDTELTRFTALDGEPVYVLGCQKFDEIQNLPL